MAADLNRCEFIGRLGKDVEQRTLKSGESMAFFSIAVGESYLNKNGERVKNTTWVNIVCYRKLAEICVKYLSKGSRVYIAGKLAINKQADENGIEKTYTNIVLDTLNILDAKKENTSDKEQSHTMNDDEDIPF